MSNLPQDPDEKMRLGVRVIEQAYEEKMRAMDNELCASPSPKNLQLFAHAHSSLTFAVARAPPYDAQDPATRILQAAAIACLRA